MPWPPFLIPFLLKAQAAPSTYCQEEILKITPKQSELRGWLLRVNVGAGVRNRRESEVNPDCYKGSRGRKKREINYAYAYAYKDKGRNVGAGDFQYGH